MAHNQTNGYLRKDIERLYHPINQHGVKAITETLDASNTEEIKIFGDVCAKVSLQTDGDLVCDVLVSVNGVTFIDTAVDAVSGDIVSYDTHNVSAIKFVRTSGSGRVHILGSI